MIPAAFVRMDKLSLTPNGKTDRKALPSLRVTTGRYCARLGCSAGPARTCPLARAWSTILKVQTLGIHDDFFELGGHSLAAVRLLLKSRR